MEANGQAGSLRLFPDTDLVPWRTDMNEVNRTLRRYEGYIFQLDPCQQKQR